MLPYETVYVKRQGKRRPTPIKMALYPRYVFAALGDVLTDYCRLRAAIPEIQGIVSESPDMWSPLVLSPSQVQLVTNAVAKTAKATEVDIHKSLRVGKQVEVSVGGIPQETRIDLITKTGIKALVDMFGGKHLVEFAFDKVRAA